MDAFAGCRLGIIKISLPRCIGRQRKQYIYLTKKEVSELILFSRVFGAEAWVGARFNNEEWRFVRAEDLRETNKNFNISLESAKNEGKTFHELVGTKALNTPI